MKKNKKMRNAYKALMKVLKRRNFLDLGTDYMIM
jgi:hypothetical protein